MSDTAAILNEQFLDKWETEGGKVKIAALGADVIKDRIREDGFLGKIFTRKTVGRPDLQVSTTHDTLVKIVQVEPYSRAMTLSFRGKPEVQYISAPRFEVPFYQIGSSKYEKTEEELMAYDTPIVDIIKNNIPNDIQEVEDRQGMLLFETAVQSAQKEGNAIPFANKFLDSTAMTAYNVANGLVEKGKCKSIDAVQGTTAANAAAGVTENKSFLLQKDDLAKLFKLFPGDGEGKGSRLKCDKFMLTDTDFEDISTWSLTQVGEKIVGQTTVDGYKYNTLLDRKYVRTLKTDIARPGNVYAFCDEAYLGGFMQMSKLKFDIDKRRNVFSFEAWENIGMYIGMVFGVRKLELYCGSSDAMDSGATDNSAITRRKSPVEEENLGRQNTLVPEGQNFPHVANFG